MAGNQITLTPMIPMKKSILMLLLAFQFSCALAGEGLDLFKNDISSYLQEQSKTPNKIIKYSDNNGSFARTVLSPDRAKSLIEELMKERDYPDKLKAAMEQYKPVSQNYVAAFNQFSGQYDAEYLDHFDFIYQLITASVKPLREANFDAIKDEGTRTIMQASAKMAQAAPLLLLKGLEQQIKENKFSQAFAPLAVARLKHLQETQSQTLK